MKPSGCAWPRLATLKTATLLASALATNSSWPSGDRHKLLGVLPDGALGCRAQSIVCSGLPSFVTSRTLTRVELAQDTYSVLPSGDRAISVGWLSVGQTAATRSLSRSSTATPDLPHRLTNRRLPPGSGRQV